MATEELGVKISVEGFGEFEKTFKKMDDAVGDVTDSYDDLSGQSRRTGSALDAMGQTFDAGSARVNKLRLAMTQLDDVQEKLKTETNALARAQLEVRADKLKKEIEDLSKVTGEGAKQTKSLGLSLTDLKSGIDMAIGVVKTFAAAAKAAFDFAQEGAQIIAVTGRFEALAGSAQNAASILDAVGVATGNTIDKMSAMQSASKLMSMGLANTSGEVAGLIRLAVKLGDQTQSAGDRVNDFALMLANQSVERLDNFGISSGRVRQRIEELMKATVGLTREQAFLQATLQFGEESLARLGDSAQSTADGYAVLMAEIKNMTDTMKASAAEGLEPTVTRFVEFMQIARETGLNLSSMGGNLQFVQFMLTGTSAAAEDYNANLEEQADATERARLYGEAWERQIAKNNVATTTSTTALNDSKVAFDMYSAATQTSEQALADYYAAQQAANESAIAAQVAFNNAAAALDEMSRAAFAKAQIDLLKQSLDDGKISSEDYAAAQEAILVQFGLLTEAEKRAQGTINTITQAFLDGKLEPAEYARLLAEVKGNLDAIDGTIIDIGWNVQMPPAHMPGNVSQGARDINVPYQHGGTLGNGSFMAGEHGPELIRGIRGGGQVVSAPATARMMGQQNSVQNNYNLTTNSMTRPGGLALEFSAMEMGSR